MKQEIVSELTSQLRESYKLSNLDLMERERAERAIKRMSELSVFLLTTKDDTREKIEKDLKIHFSTISSTTGIQAMRIREAFKDALSVAVSTAIKVGLASL